MSGNGWLDCYFHGCGGAPIDGSAWIPQECSNKVLRGGSWSNSEHLLRSAARIPNDWTAGENDWGFRVARDL